MKPDLSHIPGYLPPYTGTLGLSDDLSIHGYQRGAKDPLSHYGIGSEPPPIGREIAEKLNAGESVGTFLPSDTRGCKFNDLGYPEPADTNTAITLPTVVVMRTPHKCPVCDGCGKVVYRARQAEWTGAEPVYPCRVCDGKGVLWG